MGAITLLSERGTGRDPSRLPTLVLLDLKLPRKSGFEILEWIRKQPHLRSLSTIVLSSSDDPSDERRAYALGAHSFITKPIDFASYGRIMESFGFDFSGPA
jgi:CheY-like chemotaxis protein